MHDHRSNDDFSTFDNYFSANVKNEQLLQLQKLTKRVYFRKSLSVSIPSENFFPNSSYIYQTEKGTQIQTIKQRFIYSHKIVQ